MADRRAPMVIDLTDEDEHRYDEEYRRIVDLTQEDDDERPLQAQHEQQSRRRARHLTTQRNAPLYSTHRSVQAYNVGGIQYRVDDFFELVQPVGEFWKAQFFEVKQIWVSTLGANEVVLRGLPYARTSNMYGRFERQVNEVCQILEIDDDDRRPDEQQAMIEVRPREILAIREFHKTNADYRSARDCRFGNNPYWKVLNMGKEEKKRYRQDFAPFTCRWKMRFQYHNAGFRRVAKAFGTAAIHLLESDIDDPAYRVSDEERRKGWLKRHPTSGGGRKLYYTFGDAFCGAGCASSGARQGGLKPTIAVDFWETACDSYQRNFPSTILFRQDVHDFIVRTDSDALPHIDILHISPPCQFYSPAKVNEGKDDEKNEVALWSCGELIERIRPRIFTMEQTYGLLAERFTEHFNKLIHCLTISGYSVEWQERVELKQYGLPQDRKRLIIIGAAPGEQLPPWPAPTHGPGRKPWSTEAMAIGRIPRGVTLHDVQSARRVIAATRNPNVPLTRTIVCSGAQGLFHYSGQREFTLRELAILQGVPLDHEFVGPSRTVIKKQIGNAFPASVAKVFFESIRKFLERQDRSRNLAPPGSNDRGGPRPPAGAQRPRLPEYSRLNGDLNEDEALQRAMRESRREHRHQPKVVITLDDSDDDNDVAGFNLPHNMASLSVESSQLSPPTTGESSRSQQTAILRSALNTPSQPVFDDSRRRARAPSSAASSFTMAGSPSPRPGPSSSPCQQQQSRKRKSADDQMGSARKRVHDTIGMDDERYYEVKIADRARARAAAREEASMPSREHEGSGLGLWEARLAGKRAYRDS